MYYLQHEFGAFAWLFDKQDRKARQTRTNKFYIFEQCTFIVFLDIQYAHGIKIYTHTLYTVNKALITW